MNVIQTIIDRVRGKKDAFDYKKSYSQDGEDVLLYSLGEYDWRYKGFYVDIGAFHPVRFSNTKFFYDRGWRGINIDAMPGSMKAFKKLRKRDINLEIGVSNETKDLTYYLFREPALNTFSKESMLETVADNKLLGEKTVKTLPINDILSKYLPEGQQIDFIDMDIEGVELDVLKSLDFSRFAPKYFLVEALDYRNKDFLQFSDSEICKILYSNGYIILGKVKRTVIFGKSK